MTQGKKIAKNRQTELEGYIQKMMREVAILTPNTHNPDHLGSLFIQAAYDLPDPTGHKNPSDLKGIFGEALKQRYKSFIPRKAGLQALISYYLRKLCSLDETALRYELNMAA